MLPCAALGTGNDECSSDEGDDADLPVYSDDEAMEEEEEQEEEQQERQGEEAEEEGEKEEEEAEEERQEEEEEEEYCTPEDESGGSVPAGGVRSVGGMQHQGPAGLAAMRCL